MYSSIRTASFIVVGFMALSGLTACQSGSNLMAKIENGSLDYTEAKQLEPLQLPAEQATSPFTPLYQVPNIKTTQNGLDMENEQGTRYQLPPPKRTVATP